MEPPAKKKKKNYTTWSNVERHILLQKRIEKDTLFTGKNANSNEGWKNIAAELREQLGAEKNAVACKTQWNAMMKKYKSFFIYRSGEGTGEEATTDEAKDWEFFEEIHEYGAKKDNYHPPFLIYSRDGVLCMQQGKESSSSFVPIDMDNIPSCSRSSHENNSIPSPSFSFKSPKSQTKFERLEQHIFKRDKKTSKKLSSLLCVFGQMVQTEYPHIDASGLLMSSDSDLD